MQIHKIKRIEYIIIIIIIQFFILTDIYNKKIVTNT